MAHNISRSKRAAFIRRKPLSDLPGFRFVCRCQACQRTHEVEINELLGGLPAGILAGTIGQTIMRMRCVVCRKPPAEVVITNGQQPAVPVWGPGAF